MSISLSLRLTVSVVHEEPSYKSTLVLDVLIKISVSVAIHISVGVGREMQNSSFRLSYPHCQSSITQIVKILLQVKAVDCEFKSEMPRLLVWQRVPSEPTAYGVLVREWSSFVVNLIQFIVLIRCSDIIGGVDHVEVRRISNCFTRPWSLRLDVIIGLFNFVDKGADLIGIDNSCK